MGQVEIIDEIPVDWSKFKCKNRGVHLEKSKETYVNLCKYLHYNKDILLSDYINKKTPIYILTKENIERNVLISNYKKETLRKIEKENETICMPSGSEYIDGVLIDWNMFKGYSDKVGQIKRMMNSYIKFIKLINNNNHQLLSEYISNKDKVLINFKCGHDPFLITPGSYKSGHGCPKCAGNCKEQAENELINVVISNGHELLSEYKNASETILIDFKCKHKPSWVYPNEYKNNNGLCPMCYSLTSNARSKYDFYKLIEANGHELLSEYITNKKKVLINFKCGHPSHWIAPVNYKNGCGCPYCKNKGEAALCELLKDMGYEVKTQHKYNDLKDKIILRYDFYIPKYNLLIELDGEHHRKEVYYKTKDKLTDMDEIDAYLRLYDRRHKDKMKDDYAKDNNIPLLRIPYYSRIDKDEWKMIIEEKIKELEDCKNI